MSALIHAKRIAVIGAGPSGLVTVKELLEEGHRPICFERASGLGGVFRFGEDEGVVWESCHLTSSALLTAFSDFPIATDHRSHLPIADYVKYLERYCVAFGLTPHLRFGATVLRVEQRDGGWRVAWRDAGGDHVGEFDAVAVCSGLHQHPHLPHFAGQDTFSGEMLHSSRYRRPSQIAGKKVLVVGAGESGADVVAEVAKHASATVLSLRRGVAVQGRVKFGRPGDYRTSRISQSAAHWVANTRHPQDDWKRRIYRKAFLPLVVVDKVLQLLYRAGWEALPLARTRPSALAVTLKARRLSTLLMRQSGGVRTEQFGTKSDEFVREIARGRCRLAGAIERFNGAEVTFADDSRFAPDIVLLCTGFETRIPFFDAAIAGAPRYLHAINPAVGGSLGFIGLLRPAFGAIPPLAELQARWFALLQSGRVALPDAAAMSASIDHWARYRSHIFRPLKDRLEHLVDYTRFADALAEAIGCKPDAAALARESAGFRWRFYAGPFVAAQYRLVGPHAKPEVAREVIGSVPVVHPAPELANHFLRWKLSEALQRRHGPEFAPTLAIR